MEDSDENHPLHSQELIKRLDQERIKAERKSIYTDMNALREFGVDVQNRKGTNGGWYIGHRDFELPELKLLVDVVQSSRFITQRKSETLIRKLEKLAGKYQGRLLMRQVYVTGRVKAMNESIYYNVDKLHAAIAEKRAITFRYFEYGRDKKRVFRHNGMRYHVSPYGLVWNNENYYLVAYASATQDMRHYRVDRMTEISITCLERAGAEKYSDFDIATYGQRHFSMFSGAEEHVLFRCKNTVAGLFLDRFGQDIMLVPEGADSFTTRIPVVVSPQFFGWVFGVADSVDIVEPEHVVQQYQHRLAQAMNRCAADDDKAPAEQETDSEPT